MISIKGSTSHLTCTMFPPFELRGNSDWEIGFLDLMTYNSIPNVEENINNKLNFEGGYEINFPTGAYEITDINNYVNKVRPELKFELIANNNTLKSEIKCSKAVDFTKPNSIRELLGFSEPVVLEADKWHVSPKQVSINKVDVIRVTCNIVKGSYRDGKEGHILHEFYPNVGPGYKIVETPNNIHYLPINKLTTLDEIHIKLEDQNGDLINFRGERIVIRVHIRPKQ